MTLIIGIRCSNGIVVASDAAATFVALGQPTIQQPSSKIRVVAGSMIFGVSGSIGLAQRLEAELARMYTGGAFVDKSAVEIGGILRSAFWSNILVHEYTAAAIAQPILGPLAQQDALCAALLALPAGPHAELIQFDYMGAPEVVTEELPFAAIGSGQTIADPFLAFLKQVFWPNRAPTIGEATFAATWTLHHAITVNPGGLAFPIFVYQLSETGAGWAPRELEASERHDHLEAVTAAYAHLRGFTKGTGPGGPPPPPP